MSPYSKYSVNLIKLFCILPLFISLASSTRQVDLNSFSVRSSALQPTVHHGTGFDSGKHYKIVPDDRRTMRQLNSLSATNLQAAGSSDYGYADPGAEYGNYASAGSHGHGHGGGGGGGGHGHGHGHKKDCNSALGLLGVLGLVSFLQNVLRQMTTTAAPPPGRKRRNSDTEIEKRESDTDKITRLMMPLLMRVGQARDGQIPSECTTLEVCKANKILVKELGAEGRSLGSMLSDAIGKMLKEVDPKGIIVKQVENAARTGRSGLDCDKLFKECPKMPPASTPQFVSILQSPLGRAFMIN